VNTKRIKYVLALAVMFFSVTAICFQMKANSLMSRLQRPQVQQYIGEWVELNVANNDGWKASAKFNYALGLGAYLLNLPDFDWTVLGTSSKSGYFKLLGTPDAPEHIVFLGVGGRCAVIYSLSGKTPVDGQFVFSNEVTSVTSNLYLFDPHRED
jgi:hypothetical protein